MCWNIEISLTGAQAALALQAKPKDRMVLPENAMADALLLREERQRLRESLLGSLEAARASIARGEGIEITPESMRALAEDAKRRGRERLGAG